MFMFGSADAPRRVDAGQTFFCSNRRRWCRGASPHAWGRSPLPRDGPLPGPAGPRAGLGGLIFGPRGPVSYTVRAPVPPLASLPPPLGWPGNRLGYGRVYPTFTPALGRRVVGQRVERLWRRDQHGRESP